MDGNNLDGEESSCDSGTNGNDRNKRDTTEQLRALQNSMLEERVDLPRVYEDYVHVGFGASDARVVVTEETPSLKHFTSYKRTLKRLYGGFDNMTAEDYADFYVNREKTDTRSWPPFTKLLDPVFNEIEKASTDIFGEIYMTSIVKNPIQYSEKTKTIPAAWSDTWCSYLPKELEIVRSDAVVAVGKYAVAYTLSTLSEDDLRPADVKISQPKWWREPSIDTDRPVYCLPHWNAKKYNSDIKHNWDDLLSDLRQFLHEHVY